MGSISERASVIPGRENRRAFVGRIPALVPTGGDDRTRRNVVKGGRAANIGGVPAVTLLPHVCFRLPTLRTVALRPRGKSCSCPNGYEESKSH